MPSGSAFRWRRSPDDRISSVRDAAQRQWRSHSAGRHEILRGFAAAIVGLGVTLLGLRPDRWSAGLSVVPVLHLCSRGAACRHLLRVRNAFVVALIIFQREFLGVLAMVLRM